MATADGMLVGFLAGAVMTAGVWVFVEINGEVPPRSEVPQLIVPDRPSIAPPAPTTRAPAVEVPVVAVAPAVRGGARRDRQTGTPPALTTGGAVESPPPFDADPFVAAAGPSPRADQLPRTASAAPERARPRFAVALGGGAELSASPALDDSLQWSLRLLVDPRPDVGFELGYSGARNARVLSSSVDAIAKWSPLGSGDVRAYLLAGVGWRRFHAPLKLDVATVPVGVGLAYTRQRWQADVRLTARPTIAQDLHTLGATAHVGRSF